VERRFDEAIAAAAGEPELEDLKRARTVHAEVFKILKSLSPGDAVAGEHLRADGTWAAVRGTISKTYAQGFEIAQGRKKTFLLFKDLRLSSLAPLLTRKPMPESSWPRGGAVLALLSGDADGAASLVGAAEPVSARFRPASADAEDRAVQALFERAEQTYTGNRDRWGSIEDYRQVLELKSPRARDLADRVQERITGSKDLMASFADLTPQGEYSTTRVGRKKDVVAWMRAEDASTVPAEADRQAILLTFYAMPETTYRAWAYVGGCCSKAFDYRLQISELPDAEPGGTSSVPWKHGLTFLTQGHGGVPHEKAGRDPVRWEWVSLPLPKFAAPGVKKVRLIGTQKGACIALACVSSSRSVPPRPEEATDLARKRAEAEGRTVVLQSQDFSEEPVGWKGRGNESSGHHYGYRPNSSEAGGGKGEVGGTFARGEASYYADVNLQGPLTFSEPIIVTGRMDITKSVSPDCDVQLGWFSRGPADGGKLPPFLGINMAEPQGGAGYRMSPLLRIGEGPNDSHWGEKIVELPMNGHYRFRLAWQPRPGGGGTVDFEITGQAGKFSATRKIDVPASTPLKGISFDAFGFSTRKSSTPNPAISFDVYADELQYTGFATSR
jgi:hypothetical protein